VKSLRVNPVTAANFGQIICERNSARVPQVSHTWGL